jgi:hypothetical protein
MREPLLTCGVARKVRPADGVEFSAEHGAVGSEAGMFGFSEEGVGELAEGEVRLVGVVVREGEEEDDGGVARKKSAGFLEGADGGLGLADGAEGGAEADEGVAEVFSGEAGGDGAAVEGNGLGFLAGGVEGEGLVEEAGGRGCVHQEIIKNRTQLCAVVVGCD